MTNNDMMASDRLFHGISAIRGWGEAVDHARSFGGAYAWKLGKIMSSILLAAGEDREPLAVTGALDEDGTGNLAVVYDRFIVVVDVVDLSERKGDVAVTVHTFVEIDRLQVSATHDYFDTQQRVRHDGMELTIALAGKRYVFPPKKLEQNPLLHGAAVLKAYEAIREHRATTAAN